MLLGYPYTLPPRQLRDNPWLIVKRIFVWAKKKEL